MLRFSLSLYVSNRVADSFPFGTLSVNALGSLLIGFAYALLLERPLGGELLRLFLIVGLLGGFTTFSAFSLETLDLLQGGLWGRALLNIIASVSLCVFAAFAGMGLARAIP